MILHAYIDGDTKDMANTDQHYKHFIKMNICFILVDTDDLCWPQMVVDNG